MSSMNLTIPNFEQHPALLRPVRRKVQLPVEITHHAFVGVVRTRGVCTHVSNYGLNIDLALPLSVGEVVQFQMELPKGAFQGSARVTFRNQYHYGLYFTEITPEELAKLDLLALAQPGTSDMQ